MLKIYKETRVDTRQTAPASIVNIPIPSSSNGHGNPQQRRTKFSLLPSTSNTAYSDDTTKDEDTFVKRYLASQGAVYFRQRKTYPRSFLWRVVGGSDDGDDRFLEIKSVDLTKGASESTTTGTATSATNNSNSNNHPHPHHEANLLLRLEFPEKIVPHGVALADSEDHEVLSLFVVTRDRHLYTISLRQEFFRRVAAIDENVPDWCKLSYERSNWSAITFDEKPWGSSLRGLVKWNGHQQIRYDGRVLDPNTSNAIATTSDHAFVFVVGLNHTLKIWNLASHKLAASRDLLNRPVQQQDAAPATLNPSESAFIRVFNAERVIEGETYYAVTYSPLDDGQFKFWAVKGGLGSQLEVQDLFPDSKLKPVDPDPSGSVFWNIADFQIKSMEEGRHMVLWVLWRNNNLYQVYSLHFNLDDLESAWRRNWTGMALETSSDEPPPSFLLSDIADPAEKWLEYLFCPGRYSREILATSLAIYQDAMKIKPTPRNNKKFTPLQQQLYSTISESVTLRKFSEAGVDYTKYRRETDTKWRQFWQIADDLNRKRNEAISLSYDAFTDIPWLLFSDGNLDKELRDSDLAAALIAAAASFRKKFTPELSHACATALNAELFTEPSLSAAQRIAAFHAQSKFAELITDDMFDSMFASVEIAIGFKKLSTELFLSIIDTMPLGFPGKDSELLSTDFGRMVLYDLLLLTVFVETELTQEDGVLFDGVDLFVTLIEMLKEYEMMIWLGSNVRPWHGNPPHGRTSNAMSPTVPEGTGADKGEPRLSTILEDLFACHIKPRPTFGVPQTFTLTQQIRDVVSWITRQGEVSFPNVLVFIQCDLLASGNIDLASDFLRFQPNTAWSTYVKGRLYVAKSEFDSATIYFQKAAYILSHGKAVGNLHEMSSNLLDIISVNSFYNGLPKYFQHILSLFEQARAFAHVADFARLALQALESDPRKNEPDSDYIYLRTDLLSRLFHASLKTCRFDEAYSALSRYTDAALQKSALTALITTILAASGPGISGLQRILRFPISLAPNLASHVDEILLSLAKKQSTHGRSQGQALPTATSWQENSDIPDYQRVLQAYRVARNDIRGAAEVSYQAVQRLREMRDRGFYSTRALMMRRNANEAAATQHPEISEEDLESKNLRNELLSLINLLACMDKNENYILVEAPTPQHNAHLRGGSIINNAAAAAAAGGGDNDGDDDDVSAFFDSTMATKSPRTSFSLPSPAHDVIYSPRSSVGAGERKLSITSSQHSTGQQSKLPKRIIVTLEDLRKEYQAELDRVSRIENGDWEFGFVDSGAPDMHDDSLNNVEAMDIM
ncbi:conserved hypothetical protein [Histoplasma mississippiense (nom. inval.)]|uniref:conserved hypothetical protein n=1 Tax=Ajellomyces capsulatus (strain NAm1 / WU24) TaxID=2059318 RepID=UPI000157C071|nr:conserved hypothetical protein [Histoplasma mississippiense (nom. inval.)]EDN06874.1 conserved hypothetical protein [Histoplasma mississippiense (nom. inval.)]